MSIRIGITVSLRERSGVFRKSFHRDRSKSRNTAAYHANVRDARTAPLAFQPRRAGVASVRLPEMFMTSGEVSR
jgi:hypothetical protein